MPVIVILIFTGCDDRHFNPNKDITLNDFAQMKNDSYGLNSHIIRSYIDTLIHYDQDSLTADYRTRSYYLNNGDFLWITRHGLSDKADTLISWLDHVDEEGLSKRNFRVAALKRDLEAVRALDVDSAGRNGINFVMARLEYNLTKAFLKYAAGQRFGYMNPSYIFNRLDVYDDKDAHVSYRGLFSLKMEHAGKNYYNVLINRIRTDSVAETLREAKPSGYEYEALKKLLKNGSRVSRVKILCNLERARWRLSERPDMYKKYVMVNIPSFSLYAINEGDTISMRIGCGSFKTKTPLLTSKIKRMEINPQWIVPRSIVDKDIIHHAGNVSYFNSRHFFVRNRKSGKTVFPSWSALSDKGNLVIQEGGEGNSLGRIIFRFDNPYSVYLHHTSSTDFFSREDRGVSHGCVRVEKPFELAAFLLGDGHDEELEKISYSMSADVSSLGKKRDELSEEQQMVADTLKRDMLISRVDINPQVPLFITYYTLYISKDGRVEEFDDVYGYDAVIYNQLRQIFE